MPELSEVLPKNFLTYREPFCGGAALFFAMGPERAVLCDINRDLIRFYECLRESFDELSAKILSIDRCEEQYYRVRDEVSKTRLEAAARFYYLQKLSFNGLYRVNRNGQFNVPYGFRSKQKFLDTENALQCSKVLLNSDLRVGDFEVGVRDAVGGDLIYFDPPYRGFGSDNTNFVRYNGIKFSWDDQLRLARVSRKLVDMGCSVVVSNLDDPEIRGLYKGFAYRRVERTSCVSGKSGSRRQICEAIYYSVTEWKC